MSKTDNFEYMFAYMLEPLNAGESFTQWPLHITLIPWFRALGNVNDFLQTTQRNLETTEPFKVEIGQEQRWVRHRVHRLESSPELQALHESLLTTVRGAGKLTAPLRFVGRQFRPHVTQKLWGSTARGQRLLFDRLSLVGADTADERGNRMKYIVGNIALRGRDE